MNILFYIASAFIAMVHCLVIVNPFKRERYIQQPPVKGEISKVGAFIAFSLLWTFAGFFTWQRYFFIPLLISIILVFAAHKQVKSIKAKVTILWLNSLIWLCFCLFAIFNKYDLRIDIKQYLGF